MSHVTPTLPKLVSPDDHVQVPAHVFTERVPARWRDAAPRIERARGIARLGAGDIRFEPTAEGHWADVWHYDGKLIPLVRIAAAAGYRRDEIDGRPVTYDDMHKACYDPVARLAAMDQAGVEASVCYPNMFVRFCGQTFSFAQDKDLALACIRAYNDFIAEEWCGGSGGRLVPLGIVPLWDPELAVAEAQRLAGLGFRSITFSEAPHLLGLPSIFSGHWDRLFATCAAEGLVLSLHIGTGGFPMLAPDSSGAVPNVVASLNAGYTLTDWLFSGILQRLPELRVVLAESQLAWVPYVLARADFVWSEMRGEGFTDISGRAMPDPPSETFRRNIWCTFFRDPVGLTLLDHIGVGNVMYEVDFPHTDTSWPTSYDTAREMTGGLAPQDAARIVAENARELFRIEVRP
jgi:predicted TIM-barrel fold metal-dependent hydrolase